MNVNDKIRFRFDRLLETITFNARIYKIQNGRVFVAIPDKIASMSFAPFNGAKRISLPVDQAEKGFAAWKATQK